MIILAIDSCGSSCGACVWQDGLVLARAQEPMERGQDTRLMPMVMDVMARSGAEFSNLDKVAVTRGPGSFTGVRVGLAAAQGLGLASGKPVIGLDRFSLCRTLHRDGDLLVVIASKRAELFCRFFPSHDAAHEACLMTQQEIDAFVLSNPGAAIAGDVATPNDDVLAAAATHASTADARDPDFLPRPLYLRAPDVTFPSASLSKPR